MPAFCHRHRITIAPLAPFLSSPSPALRLRLSRALLLPLPLALVAATARPLSSSPLAPCCRHRSVDCMVHAAAGTEGRYAWTFDGVTVVRTSLLRPPDA
ncbi:hypothetical protein BGW80DRAFT_1329099 [Lactifluus volemus]|nr:hypothetical protein BGW80DRAFT_1329099 [Lactifluus volemus]